MMRGTLSPSNLRLRARVVARFIGRVALLSLLPWPTVSATLPAREGASPPLRAQCTHTRECSLSRVLNRQHAAPTVIRYSQQQIEIDPISLAERALPGEEYEFACDGERWCIRSGSMILSSSGGAVTEWDTRQRLLVVLPAGSNPHPESVMFALTQAQEFNDVIPVGVFVSACTCGVATPAGLAMRDAMPDAGREGQPQIRDSQALDEVDAQGSVQGWKNTIECDMGDERFVRAWQLVIPSSTDPNRSAHETRIRVAMTTWDRAGLPLQLLRVVEEWHDGVKLRTRGRSVITVSERRAYDAKTDAGRLRTPTLGPGWTVSDTTRSLQYVYGSASFTLAGFSFHADSPIQVPPDELHLRELLATKRTGE